MPHDSETADYEPLNRSQTSKVLGAEPDDNSLSSPMLLGASLRDVVTANNDQGWPSRNPTGNEVSIQEGVPGKQKANNRVGLKENWIFKRGHAVSYIGLLLFTAVLFFRPYEIIPALASFNSMAYWAAIFTLAIFIPSQIGLEGNLTARPREVKLVLLLCVAALISMPLAASPGLSWKVFNEEFIKAILMFIVLVNVVRTERRLKVLLLLALAVSVYLSWYALNDYRHGKFIDEFSRVKGAIGGMFGNPNDMALHLVSMLPIAVALLLLTRNYLVKLLYGICGVLILSAIVVTFSRGGFLGLIASGLVMAWKFGRRNRPAVLGVTILVLLLFIAFAPGSYGTRVSTIVDSATDITGSSSARTELLKRSIVVSIANPVFGIGMGNFPIVGIQNQVSHNAYTQVSAEMGLAAMVIYVMFILAPIKRLRQIERETMEGGKQAKRFYYLAIGLQASLVGYMVSSFFVSVAYQFYVYYLVGYAISLRRIYGTGLRESVSASVGSYGRTQTSSALNQSQPTERCGNAPSSAGGLRQ